VRHDPDVAGLGEDRVAGHCSALFRGLGRAWLCRVTGGVDGCDYQR
jgi:hypothetical protein